MTKRTRKLSPAASEILGALTGWLDALGAKGPVGEIRTGTDVAKKKGLSRAPSKQAHAEAKGKAQRARGKSPVKVAPPREPVDVMKKAK